MNNRPAAAFFLCLLGMISIGVIVSDAAADQEPSVPVLEPIPLADFSRYPEGWEARGGMAKADGIYEPAREGDASYLRARESSESVRLFKKIPWDSAAYPIVEWRWRVTKWPETAAARVAIYIALDRDVFGIPTLTKYYWSRDEAAGELKEGGMFRPAERVIRSGQMDSSDWIVERVDARADFQKISGRDPRGEAYGIGLMVDPGIEAEIGEIIALPR
ncbi:MAG: DUF3047 domain-containing protein [Nitrospirae bacterium]|nr:DUF3047 domain-containing protein [Nitrospirota bacterium]